MGLFNINDDEEWRDIPEWEGMYQISNKGRVKSVDRYVTGRDGVVKHRQEKLISIRPSGSGYCNVSLYRDNKEHNKGVHRLVAQAFIPNPKNLPEVDHIDSNPMNNCVENLRWVTAAENTAHRIRDEASCAPKKVLCVDSGEVFVSITAAGRSVNAGSQQIIDSIKTKSCCKGKVFVYADDTPEDIEEYAKAAHAKYQNYHPTPKMPNSRKVIAVETGQIFNSMTEAASFFNCDPATVRNRAMTGKTYNGITLKFITD